MQRPTDDIAHLYQEFGGKPQSYRELARSQATGQARDRWPLISRVEDLSAGVSVPPVRAGEDTTAEPPRWLAAAPAVQPPPHVQATERIEPTLTARALQTEHAPDAEAVSPWPEQAGASAPAAREEAHAPEPKLAPSPHPPTPVAAVGPTPASSPMFASLARHATQRTAPAADAFSPTAQTPARSPAWAASPATAAPAMPAPAAAQQAAAASVSAHPGARALEGRSPLSRFVQPAPPAPPRTGNLQKLFARLRGRDDS